MDKLYWNTREELGTILNQAGLLGLGVEVGTQLAQFASRLRSTWQGKKLFCVDPWKAYYGVDMDDAAHESYYRQARAEMNRFPPETWEFMRMPSMQAAAFMAEAIKRGDIPQLDFVFLDDDHDYQPVLDGIDAWYPLIKPGGFLCGHDWVVDGWHKNNEPYMAYPERPQADQCGPFYVRKAVLERFSLDQLTLTAPDMDLGWQSWGMRKPL